MKQSGNYALALSKLRNVLPKERITVLPLPALPTKLGRYKFTNLLQSFFVPSSSTIPSGAPWQILMGLNQ